MATVSAFHQLLMPDCTQKATHQSPHPIISAFKTVPNSPGYGTSGRLKRTQFPAFRLTSNSETNLINKYINYGRVKGSRQMFDEMPQRDATLFNTMIEAYIRHGNPKEAMKLLHRMQLENALEQCKQIHGTILKAGHGIDVFTGSMFINTYAKCQQIEDARQVFDKMPQRNFVSWNAMIAAYMKCECEEMALRLFQEMQLTYGEVDEFTLSSVLSACSSLAALDLGLQIHAHIVKFGFGSNVYAATALIDMYAKCGFAEEFCRVFDGMSDPNLVTWTAVIAGYTQNGLPEKAIEVFNQILMLGIKPNMVMLARVLRASCGIEAIGHGLQVHGYIVKIGLFSDIDLRNALIDMYVKCGDIDSAYGIFDKMNRRDILSWNTMVAGFVQSGKCHWAVGLFQEIKLECLQPDQYTFSSLLKACAALGDQKLGMGIHGEIIKTGFGTNVFAGNALVDMYCKCDMVHKARQVFDKMPERSMVSWAAMISGYAQSGYGEEALKLVCMMLETGVNPEESTLTSVLLACSTLAELGCCKMVYAHIIRKGFDSNLFVRNALVDAYSKCGSLDEALQVFNAMSARDVVSWNAMIAGTVRNGDCDQALKLFFQMWFTGIEPDDFTLSSVIRACASLAIRAQGKCIHSYIIKNGWESNIWVGTSLLDMYMKCGSLGYAQRVFKRMPEWNVISWTAMIEGYVQNGEGEEAMKLFRQMLQRGTKPDVFTLASVLNACASLTALEIGKQVHSFIIQKGLDLDMCVGNAIIDMYAKCGSLVDAQKGFEKKCKRDIVSWNAMIGAYAQHGYGKEAIQLFEQMQQEGMKPNHVTFVCVLSACSNAGQLREGHQLFDSISRDHGITLKTEHYACMVDLLGRAGKLDEAQDLINQMPFEPSALVWRTLLAACRIHGNIETGKLAAEHVMRLEPHDSATYVLLSNIYAAAGRWDCLANVRKTMEDNGVKKEPGLSWIEVKGRVHTFAVMDR